jgi:spermidine dehydrogenase
VAIAINRWPHGYSYMASLLWGPVWAKGQEPFVLGRKPFGRITIANADAGGLAESYVSIDQTHRAVEEIAAMVAA